MKAQGIVEYILVLILVAVVVIVVLALLGPSIGNIMANINKSQEIKNAEYAQQVFDYRNRLIEACLKSEQYTREECILLAGAGSQ